MQEKPVRMSRKPGESQGRPLKITFGEMREMGLRRVLVHCHCGHNVALSADRWPDDVRLPDIEPRFVCAGCGNRGALRSRRISAAASRRSLRPLAPVSHLANSDRLLSCVMALI